MFMYFLLETLSSFPRIWTTRPHKEDSKGSTGIYTLHVQPAELILILLIIAIFCYKHFDLKTDLLLVPSLLSNIVETEQLLDKDLQYAIVAI